MLLMLLCLSALCPPCSSRPIRVCSVQSRLIVRQRLQDIALDVMALSIPCATMLRARSARCAARSSGLLNGLCTTSCVRGAAV
eukprot:3665403-Lingulodinium_polyedra.AAC.1